MTSRQSRVYLDANVLIAFVANEQDRADVIEAVLEDARDEKIELFTSVLSIAEVAFISTDQPGVDPLDSEEAIDQLWVPASPITMADVSIRVVREARAIIRKSRGPATRTVKPADAIHLASAAISRCDRFFTYEGESTRAQWQGLTGLNVVEPFLDEPRLNLGG